jgi:hypothetical protein
LQSTSYQLFNVPGLLEADPDRVRVNAQLLNKALSDQTQPSLVLFLLTCEGGRITNNDYVAYHALKAAFDFSASSLAFIVSKVRKKDKRNELSFYIQKMFDPREVFFVPEFDIEDEVKKSDPSFEKVIETVSQPLVDLMCRLRSQKIKQIGKLTLMEEQLNKFRMEARAQAKRFEELLAQSQQQISALENKITSLQLENEKKPELPPEVPNQTLSDEKKNVRDRLLQLGKEWLHASQLWGNYELSEYEPRMEGPSFGRFFPISKYPHIQAEANRLHDQMMKCQNT